MKRLGLVGIILRVTVILGIVWVLLMNSTVLGEVNLTPRQGEPAEYTYNQRFSFEQSMESLNYLYNALQSFKKLTGRSKDFLSKEELDDIRETSWEEQNLGFENHLGAVRGTIRKQEYQIKKLQYELAKERLERGKISKEELDQTEIEYKKAEAEFQKFWNSFGIAD